MTEPSDGTGRWCWSRSGDPRPWNRYVYFRKSFALPTRPNRAMIRISADSRYTLFVNARHVHHGPARCDPTHQSFDTLDIAPLLETGANVIAVIVHSHGVPTAQTVHRGAAGLWIDGRIDLPDADPIPLSTLEGWRCRNAKGWRQDVARFSLHMGFQEHFDAGADPSDWMSPEYAPSPSAGWADAIDLGPAGVMPWFNLSPRGIPLLDGPIEPFAATMHAFVGENARGYKVAQDVFHHAAGETRKREKNLFEDPQHCLSDDDRVMTVPATEDGQFVALILDPGQYRVGHLILDLAEACDDQIIDILYAQSLDKNGMVTMPPAGDDFQAPADRLRCAAGPQRFATFGIRGFRYVALIFRNIAQPLKLRFVGVRLARASLRPTGRFECSDPVLTRIWSVARDTQRLCSLDGFISEPFFEQAQDLNTARVQGQVAAYAFGDAQLLARGIEQAAQSQLPDGSLALHPPSDQPVRQPDAMLGWISSIQDYFQQTSDMGLICRVMPTVHRVLAFFGAREAEDGLLGRLDGFRVAPDQADLAPADLSAALNLLYLQALRDAASLCQMIGDATGQVYQQQADNLARMIDERFWDPDQEQFCDGWNSQTKHRIDRFSQYTNALAILSGLKPQMHEALARETLLKPARSRRGKIIAASPSGYAQVLQALCSTGLKSQVIQIIGDKWSTMLDDTSSTFGARFDEPADGCHASSASPLYFLSRLVLGVVPVAPGWDRVVISPVIEKLDFARGVVPTPHGPVSVEWERVGKDQIAVRIDLPEGIQAEFIDPAQNRRTLPAGSSEFSA